MARVGGGGDCDVFVFFFCFSSLFLLINRNFIASNHDNLFNKIIGYCTGLSVS